MSAFEDTKLELLMEIYGHTEIAEFLQECVHDFGLCPAICMNDGCEYTDEMEPDQHAGYCEDCGTNSMSSALILARLI